MGQRCGYGERHDELVRRGYGEADIAKLWGRNLLRVWAEVERVATARDVQPAR